MSGRPGAGRVVVVRDALPADLPIIQAIYSHHVLHGLASFEEVPPDAAEIERRYRDIVAHGLPYVVAECGAASPASLRRSLSHAAGLPLHGRGLVYVAPMPSGRDSAMPRSAR
jgi:hypothetical protein